MGRCPPSPPTAAQHRQTLVNFDLGLNPPVAQIACNALLHKKKLSTPGHTCPHLAGAGGAGTAQAAARRGGRLPPSAAPILTLGAVEVEGFRFDGGRGC